MLYCENWDQIQERFREFWTRENHDRPLLQIQVLKDRHANPPVSNHATLRERWMDTDYMIETANWQMQNTLYLGGGGISFAESQSGTGLFRCRLRG